MCSLASAFILLAGVTGTAYSPAPVPLHDGQQITISGDLTMEQEGRLQFVTVKTTSSYVPIFIDENHNEVQGETLHEIGLSGYDYRLVYAYRGQQVTVTGKMLTDEATPYFWRGTRLEVASLRTSGGVDLAARPLAKQAVPKDVTSYPAGATLHANLALPWTYQVKGKAVTTGTYLSCSSNGGGDVVNCFCADGFHPVQAGQLMQGARSKGQIYADTQMAQFDVGDDATEVHLNVTCSR